ncbi:MAG TPA: DinB family protein [Terriglobales bacterium]|nr:DinB family protein [Terriglobales bacterium]
MPTRYAFLLDTYETEILKIVTIWSAFPESKMDFRPAAKSRSVIEQYEHQVQSEGRWMKVMLGLDTGDPNPAQRTKRAFIEKYRTDAEKRLALMREKSESWWEEPTAFFDVTRSKAWIMTRRMTHSSHHRGQLIVYLRLLDIKVPSVYGPTADTDGKVMYAF